MALCFLWAVVDSEIKTEKEGGRERGREREERERERESTFAPSLFTLGVAGDPWSVKFCLLGSMSRVSHLLFKTGPASSVM